MPFCTKCGNYRWSGAECHCAPFEVFHRDYHMEGDPYVVNAMDAEGAAEAYAKYYNEDGDYVMMNGEPTIKVRVGEGEKAQWFFVSAEPCIEYHVQEVSEDDDPDN